MNSQSQAQERYFGHARREISPLLPDHAQRVLEIGCSSGATLAWLRDRWPHAEMLGVDGHAPLAPVIRARAARAVIHDLETPLPDLGRFDLILALDVLEHLRAPEQVLADREISWPLTRAMCSPIGDGASAALLCSGRALAGLSPAVRERAVRVRTSVMTASSVCRARSTGCWSMPLARGWAPCAATLT
jgi:2-polyprenyl-3-methyl-5-hydroxy-6-metoxy-1,4-benzoquinol methylase